MSVETMRLSIIIPVYHEKVLVGPLVDRVMAMDPGEGVEKEVLLVDDGSTDGTREVLEELAERYRDQGVRLYCHESNAGKGAAVRTGVAAATGEVMIIQDADLEYDPEEIPMVIAPIVRGEEKVVYGSRILKEKSLGRSGILGVMRGKHPRSYYLAYLGGVLVTKWTNLWTGASLTDEPTCYKAFHREVMEGEVIESDDFSWEPEMTVKWLARGYRIAEVPISYHPRTREEGKKIAWKHGISALVTVCKYVRR